MRRYLYFFRMRFQTVMQYRGASAIQMITNMMWGLMECLAYSALQQSNAVTFPMEFHELVSYIWLRQAFFGMFTTWQTDNDIFDIIINGDISYELCRPVSIYRMWFARTAGGRVAQAVMRSVPIYLIAMFMPGGYRLSLPKSPLHLLMFMVAMVLGLGVTVAFCMLVYISCFFTISPAGVRLVFMGSVEFLSGSVIPLPFVPYPVRGILEFLPFASMQNVPFRIYSGNLDGSQMVQALILQVFWLAALIAVGQWMQKRAEGRIVLQGG